MAANKVLEALKKAGKPLKTAEIAELTKLDKDEVSKIIKTLKKDGAIVSPKNCYYSVA
jgi:DNA-binding IclR family transcriptional regulator